MSGVSRVSFPKIETLHGSIFKLADAYDVAPGEVYISVIEPGMASGWKCHKRFSNFLYVVVGSVIVKYSLLPPESGIQADDKITELVLSAGASTLLKIDHMVWYQFTNGSEKTKAQILAISSGKYEETEVDRLEL